MPPKILVVDDDPVMLGIYSRVFSGKDYLITFAGSIAEAAALIKTNCYDLLVTDLLLGDGLGTELTVLFTQKIPGAKSLIVSGSLGEADPEALSTATECLTKPLNIAKFMETISIILDVPLAHKP